MALAAGEARRDGDDEPILRLRHGQPPALQPGGARPVAVRVLQGIHAARDDPHARWVHLRIVLAQVFQDPVGDGDDALAAGHDGAVAIGSVRAVHGGEKSRPPFRFELAPSHVRDPGRQPRAGVQNVDLLAQQQLAQRPHVVERERALLADGPGDVPCAGRLQLRHHSSPGRHHQRAMPAATQLARHLHRTALDPASVQRGQHLQYGEGHGCFAEIPVRLVEGRNRTCRRRRAEGILPATIGPAEEDTHWRRTIGTVRGRPRAETASPGRAH